MKREIKFRGYAKPLEHFPSLMFQVWGITEKEVLVKSKTSGILARQRDKVEVVQYTGFKDQDNKGEEIYHKDMIINSSRNDGKAHIVEWSEKFGGWVGLYGNLEYLIAPELHEIKLATVLKVMR